MELKWNINDAEAKRANAFNMGGNELCDLVDETSVGANTILKILENATEKGYIVPRGEEFHMVEMFIRTQLPNNVLEVLHMIDDMNEEFDTNDDDLSTYEPNSPGVL